jgi:hypothetical protein
MIPHKFTQDRIDLLFKRMAYAFTRINELESEVFHLKRKQARDDLAMPKPKGEKIGSYAGFDFYAMPKD